MYIGTIPICILVVYQYVYWQYTHTISWQYTNMYIGSIPIRILVVYQ